MNDKAPRDPAHRWTWERALRERSAVEGLSARAQHVALMMATYADPSGDGIRPSIESLCTATGRKSSAINLALAELRETGWVHQVTRGNAKAKRASEYRLAIPTTSSGRDTNKP